MHLMNHKDTSAIRRTCLWLVLLALSGAPQAEAAKAAFFVQTLDGANDKGKQTGAILNWMVQKLVDHPGSAKKGITFIDRGLFFSNSGALGAKRWLRKARQMYTDGSKNYATPSDSVTSAFRRAVQFYHYAHPYYLKRERMQKSLYMLSMLLYRKKQKGPAWRFLSRGLLMRPNAGNIGSLRSGEQSIVDAARCLLAKKKTGKIVITTRNPSRAVYLNGYLVGFGDVTIDKLAPGEYYISVREDGFRRWGRRRVFLRPGATKRAFARNMRSPQYSFYRDLCKQMMPIKEGEQLTDKMKIAAQRLKVDQLWVGCYKANATGDAGNISWLFYKDGSAATKGSLPVPAALGSKFQVLSRLTKAMGYPLPKRVPANFMRYPRLQAKAQCPDFDALLKKTLAPVIKYLVVYTKYGFRLQGKLIRKTAEALTLQVASAAEPSELKSVEVPKSMIKYKWTLGEKQLQGMRLGERVVIRTVFDLVTSGRLVAISEGEVKIKTKFGIELVPRTMIKKIYKRDR